MSFLANHKLILDRKMCVPSDLGSAHFLILSQSYSLYLAPSITNSVVLVLGGLIPAFNILFLPINTDFLRVKAYGARPALNASLPHAKVTRLTFNKIFARKGPSQHVQIHVNSSLHCNYIPVKVVFPIDSSGKKTISRPSCKQMVCRWMA